MKMLMHICCAPCSIYPLEQVLENGFEVTGYYHNPNIHPYTEWKKRKETLEQYAVLQGFPLIVEQEYGMKDFLRAVVHREDFRCTYCYTMRLQKSATMALQEGFDCFSSTLLVSPYQKHALIKEIGEAIAGEMGIPFYYQDFRLGYQDGVAKSKAMDMYRQKYCGCIYSEQERYDKKMRKKQPKQNENTKG